MDRKKFLAFFHQHELRVEQLGEHLWAGSCRLALHWDTWTDLSEEAVKRSALATANKLLTHLGRLDDVVWRDLSDMPEEDWARGLAERSHPGYLKREGISEDNYFPEMWKSLR